MIRDLEIKETARWNGVPETTIEKDYALNWKKKKKNKIKKNAKKRREV